MSGRWHHDGVRSSEPAQSAAALGCLLNCTLQHLNQSTIVFVKSFPSRCCAQSVAGPVSSLVCPDRYC